MLAPGRVPVRAGALEARALAAADGVEMGAVMAGREPGRLDPHLDAAPRSARPSPAPTSLPSALRTSVDRRHRLGVGVARRPRPAPARSAGLSIATALRGLTIADHDAVCLLSARAAAGRCRARRGRRSSTSSGG